MHPWVGSMVVDHAWGAGAGAQASCALQAALGICSAKGLGWTFSSQHVVSCVGHVWNIPEPVELKAKQEHYLAEQALAECGVSASTQRVHPQRVHPQPAPSPEGGPWPPLPDGPGCGEQHTAPVLGSNHAGETTRFLSPRSWTPLDTPQGP